MSVLSANTQQEVEASLVRDGLITSEELEQARKKAEKARTPFFGYLVNEGIVSDEALTKKIAHATKVPYVNLQKAYIDPKILDLLPQEIAERYMAVPLGEMQNRLVLAMLDANNVQAVDFLANKIGRPIKVYAASEGGIRQVLQQYGANISKRVVGEISTAAEELVRADQEEMEQRKRKGKAAPEAHPHKNIKTIVQDSPISKALSTILDFAGRNNASDIHVEPLEDALKIRCRIDGVLREIMSLPKSTEPPLISRIKILANLKIDEHRIPQDGEFSIRVGEKEIDLRIAISPVIWGEQVVIRLLDKTGTSLKLEDMGYIGRNLRLIREALKQSHGMVLTSGPTGSGKSTSLYALLNEIKSDEINIVTLEDPVEYKMPGINQIQVNSEVGLTFSTGLRSILRQDPDVVMVGEIRDAETAQLAVQAALTGHLVFSTLHTNSASGILPRLLDMGIEPFLIASTVHTVIGQRLVRRVAPEKEQYQSSLTETAAIQATIGRLLPRTEAERDAFAKDIGYQNLPLATQNAYTLSKGIESPTSPGGYKGRMGIYEVFNVTEEIQKLILQRGTSAQIQQVAKAQGMIDMREDGFLKAIAGQTTIAEVNRVAAGDA